MRFLGQEKAAGGLAPSKTPPQGQEPFPVAPVTKETLRQQGHDGSKRAGQELRGAAELQREKDLHRIARELGKGWEG